MVNNAIIENQKQKKNQPLGRLILETQNQEASES
jgi:hypothetical protein